MRFIKYEIYFLNLKVYGFVMCVYVFLCYIIYDSLEYLINFEFINIFFIELE